MTKYTTQCLLNVTFVSAFLIHVTTFGQMRNRRMWKLCWFQYLFQETKKVIKCWQNTWRSKTFSQKLCPCSFHFISTESGPQVFFFLSCFIKVGNTFPLRYVPVHQHQVLWTSLSRTWPSTSVFFGYYDKINWFHLLLIQLLCCVLQLCVFCIVTFTM